MFKKISIAFAFLCVSNLCFGMARVSQQGSRSLSQYISNALSKFYPKSQGSSTAPISAERGILKLENKDNALRSKWAALEKEYVNQERILANAEYRYDKISVFDRLFPSLQKRRREIAMRDMQNAKNSMQLLRKQGQVVKDQASTFKKQINTALGKDVSVEGGLASLENKDAALKAKRFALDREYANQERIIANAENRYEKISVFDKWFPSLQKRRREMAIRDVQDAKKSIQLLQQQNKAVKDQSLTLKKQVNKALEQE